MDSKKDINLFKDLAFTLYQKVKRMIKNNLNSYRNEVYYDIILLNKFVKRLNTKEKLYQSNLNKYLKG